tara:strand:+ start:413 stop:523 length:111 start_codon:yes stop_codon:yes gene_type:complete
MKKRKKKRGYKKEEKKIIFEFYSTQKNPKTPKKSIN